MLVIISSECSDDARDRSQKVLDDFLERKGRRTWAGRITQQGLDRVRRTLAKSASRSTSICCQRVVGTRSLKVEWFVGNRKRFDSRGNCVVRESERSHYGQERDSSPFERLSTSAVNLAALFHDLGKHTEWFQAKLRGSQPVSDAVRHELVSAAVIAAMCGSFESEADFLEALADPAWTSDIIRDGYAEAFQRPEFYLFGSTAPTRFLHLKAAIVGAKEKQYPILKVLKAGSPKIAIMQALVLSHHRLPGSRINKAHSLSVTVESLVNRQRFNDLDEKAALTGCQSELESIFRIPASLKPIWEDAVWIAAVAEAARALLDASVTDYQADLQASAIYARTALILGDHKASAIGNMRFPEEGVVPDAFLAYANTNGMTRALAEVLPPHLVRVKKETDRATQVIFSMSDDFPGLSGDEIPDGISQPRADKASRFRWQVDAGRAVRKTMSALPAAAGFFGILNAGTGAGKTRAAPIIMSAANANAGRDLRLNMCTGLRSLTLQAGVEYRKDMNFGAEDVSVVIGDKLSMDMFEETQKSETAVRRGCDLGTEAAPLDEPVTVQLDMSFPTRPLPLLAMRLAGREMSDPNVSMLAAPILVSTIDMLMTAADATRGNHVLKTLRVATADTVIDEIDNFGNEDIVAISRLVFLSAAFGRKVLISSATVTPEIARSLHAAYQAGWKVFEHARGRPMPLAVGWFSNTAGPVCSVLDSATSFADTHRSFTDDMVSELLKQSPKRKLRVSDMSVVKDSTTFFSHVNKEIMTEHSNNHIEDDITGRRLSIGVVRWNNVAPSMMHACSLLADGLGDDVDVFVIPYNGTLLPVVRHELEKVINPMLRRKLEGGRDPVLRNEHVRRVLDGSTNKDVVIVVVTTSMEEVGRDHDFDWCVVEPGSARGLVQMVGRVLRHRERSIKATNVCVLQRCFRDMRNEWGGNPELPAFAYPGVETPFRKSERKKAPRLSSHDANLVYDVLTMSESVDARELIQTSEPDGELARQERQATSEFLEQKGEANAHASVSEFLTDPLSLLVSHHPRKRRFRRSTGIDFSYFISDRWGHRGWKVVQSRKPKHGPTSCKLIESICIDQSRLFLRFADPVIMASDLAAKLWGDDTDIPQWKLESLLTIVRPLRDAKDARTSRFCYHPALGFTEKKDWTAPYF